jgi:hypothetical protein
MTMSVKQARVKDLVFRTVWDAAIKAANEAGDKWVAKGQGWFPCGFGYVKILDRRTEFYRWYKKNIDDATWCLHIPHKYTNRQELCLAVACSEAALDVFRKAGITGLGLYSNID